MQSFHSARPIAIPRLKNLVCLTIYQRLLAQNEMQTVLSNIWTCDAVSISYDANHYSMNTFFLSPLSLSLSLYIYIYNIEGFMLNTCFQVIVPVVFWLVNTSSSNNKTNHDMWGK